MIKIISPDDFIKAANTGDIDEFCRTAAEKTYEKLVKLQITAKKTAVVAGDGITGGVAAYLVGIMQKNGCDVKFAFLSFFMFHIIILLLVQIFINLSI